MTLEAIQHYKTAVQLNNAGVDLLENRCFEQARLTFQVAAATLRAALPPSADEKGDAASKKRTALEQRRQELLSRLQNPERMPTPTSNSSLRTKTSSSTFQADEIGIVYPVRLECNDSVANHLIVGQEPHWESACLLHNYALSHHMLSLYRGSTAKISHHRKAALDLWLMVSAILEKEQLTENLYHIAYVHHRQRLILNWNVLEAMSVIVIGMGNPRPISWATKQVSVESMLGALDFIVPHANAQKIAAAAA